MEGEGVVAYGQMGITEKYPIDTVEVAGLGVPPR